MIDRLRGMASALVCAAFAVAPARADEGAAAAGVPVEASASEECATERILVLRSSGELDAKLIAEVRTDLATELDARGLALCDPPPSGREPSVLVELTPGSDAIVIAVDDRVTHKRVARDLSLASIPANGRALAIAIAIDELIRASWAELELPRGTPAGAQAVAQPTPDERIETRAVNARGEQAEPARPLRLTLRATASYAHTRHSFDALGAALGIALQPFRHGWLELRVQGMASFAAESASGDAFARGVGSSLTFGGCFPPAGAKLFGCLGARAGADWFVLRGANARDASPRAANAGVLTTGGAGLLGISFGERWHWLVELSLTQVVRGARATDGARTVIGVASALLGVQTGVGVRL